MYQIKLLIRVEFTIYLNVINVGLANNQQTTQTTTQ